MAGHGKGEGEGNETEILDSFPFLLPPPCSLKRKRMLMWVVVGEG